MGRQRYKEHTNQELENLASMSQGSYEGMLDNRTKEKRKTELRSMLDLYFVPNESPGKQRLPTREHSQQGTLQKAHSKNVFSPSVPKPNQASRFEGRNSQPNIKLNTKRFEVTAETMPITRFEVRQVAKVVKPKIDEEKRGKS